MMLHRPVERTTNFIVHAVCVVVALLPAPDFISHQGIGVPTERSVTANGREAVLLNVYQQPGANSVAIVKDVKARIAAAKVPTDVQIQPYYDQSELVLASHSVRDAIVIGAIFAALVLFLFLWDWRVTLIIALMLPVVLAATVLLLKVLNMSFNIMTLGGMAAAVGLIVDDGVVMLEHHPPAEGKAMRRKTGGTQ